MQMNYSNKPAAIPEKKQAVVEAKAKLRPSFKSIFAGESMGEVFRYTIRANAVPAARRFIADFAHSLINAMLYGIGSSYSGKYDVPNGGNTAYNKQFNGGGPKNVVGARPETVIFRTKEDAERVLSRLFDDIENNGHTTVGDLYTYSGVDARGYTYRGIGWHDLTGVTITDTYDGWLLNLPRYENID